MTTNAVRWPAEWESHEATWLSWPTDFEDWDNRKDDLEAYFAQMAVTIAKSETVFIFGIVGDNKARLYQTYPALNQRHIHIYDFPTDAIWIRDFGPLWTWTNGTLTPLNFTFNGWALYEGHNNDNAVTSRMCGSIAVAPEHKGRAVVLEGGSIDTNGADIIMTTRQCLLNDVEQIRNPGFSQGDYEAVFKTYFGCSKVIWLNNGLSGDDTNGHIDDMARFVSPTQIVLAQASDLNDPNAQNLAENKRILSEYAKQFSLEIIDLPMPEPVRHNGDILPASYANFYICNTQIVLPVFDCKHDDTAIGILKECFPNHTVTPIQSRLLVHGLGGIHCMTMQQPANSLHK